MRICEEDVEQVANLDYDIFWSDTGMPPEKLQKLKPYQRLNHFPGMYVLARKNHLGKHLNKMRRRFDKEYDFFPRTWMLPSEMADLKAFNQSCQEKNIKNVFIIKPEASFQIRNSNYKDGLTRLATETYHPVNNNNIDEMCMHLTNYAVNKFSSNFLQNKDAKNYTIHQLQ